MKTFDEIRSLVIISAAISGAESLLNHFLNDFHDVLLLIFEHLLTLIFHVNDILCRITIQLSL